MATNLEDLISEYRSLGIEIIFTRMKISLYGSV